MKNRKRRLLAVLGATALVATGCGSAASSDTAQTAAGASASQTSTTQQQTGQPPQGGGPDVSALAETLGVDETKLQEAMASLRPDQDTGGTGGTDGTGSPPDPSDMAAELAEALSLDEEAVADAMPTPPEGASS